MLDCVVKGGQVVTPQAVGEMDVGIQGEKIVAVGWSGTLSEQATRVIDASGKIVIPGGIEPHAHIGIPVPSEWSGQPDIMTQAAPGRQPGRRVRGGSRPSSISPGT